MGAAALYCVLLLLLAIGDWPVAAATRRQADYPLPAPAELPDDLTECTAQGTDVLCYEAPSCRSKQDVLDSKGSLELEKVRVTTTEGCTTIVKSEYLQVGSVPAYRVQISLPKTHLKVHVTELQTIFADASISPSQVYCTEFTKDDGFTRYCDQLGERKRVDHGDRLYLVHFFRYKKRPVTPPSPPQPATTTQPPTTTTTTTTRRTTTTTVRRVPTTKKTTTTTTKMTTKKTTKMMTTTRAPAVKPEDDHHHDHDADSHEGGKKTSMTATIISIVVPLIIVGLIVFAVVIYCKQKNATRPPSPYNAPSTNVSTASVPRVSPSARASPSVRKDDVIEEREKSPSVMDKVASVISGASKSIPKKSASAERENLDTGSKSIPKTSAERENLDV